MDPFHFGRLVSANPYHSHSPGWRIIFVREYRIEYR